jgi:hypothetical protein
MRLREIRILYTRPRHIHIYMYTFYRIYICIYLCTYICIYTLYIRSPSVAHRIYTSLPVLLVLYRIYIEMLYGIHIHTYIYMYTSSSLVQNIYIHIYMYTFYMRRYTPYKT